MILQKTLAFIEENHMLEECETVILGVSGGADSVCLLLVMEEICKQKNIAIKVVHIEHGIRGKESIKDAKFVEKLCKEKEIPFFLYSYDVPDVARESGESVEEAGRRLRYEAFEKTAAQFPKAKIAVAHNENDDAETVLFHMARGTGLLGLIGIAPVRGNIIRPLLAVSRKEIEAYLEARGQDYCTDSTNALTIYARNRIRHEVLPALEQVNEKAVSHIAKMSYRLSEVADYIKEETKRICAECAEEYEMRDAFLVKKQELYHYPVFLRKEVLYTLYTKLAGSCKNIGEEHIMQLLELFDRQTGKQIDLPYHCQAFRVYEGIRLQKGSKKELNGKRKGQIESLASEFTFRIIDRNSQNLEIPKNKYTKWFDYDRISVKLQIRFRQEGDYFLLDESGRKKKLKDYFIDEKIPREDRDEIPLLADGKHVLWIVGYRISAYYKVTGNTTRILEVHYNGGNNNE